ncbi:CCA tRNA nucleotidyltransferase [Alteromonas sediminis]|uniref:CCA tRNA nucleotidyltransferase n=2 Tax=Alteromonas sediminis TaxID=2259342 RepID=A0A3N5ZDM3_9ALTE|nr:CCA tRNA nucleotidyltransferase [Alteromonas sediminis]
MIKNAKVYLVGGAVRDSLLDIDVKERDWVVVGATHQNMVEQGFIQVGKDFPVYLHPTTKEEYALARTERKSGQGYTGFTCDASEHVTLEDDLLRRDLTINAIAQDSEGNLYDPYHGLDDIKLKKLRHVSPAFSEDPLRILRVARFAARFAHLGFTLADDTLQLMQTMSRANELTSLAAERVWRETEKALSERRPDIFFQVLANANAISPWFTPLYPDIAKEAPLHLLQKIASEHDSDSVKRCCIAISLILPTGNASTWLKQIKAPKKLCQFSHTVDKVKDTLSTITDNPSSTLALFNRADVWRKEEEFLLMLDVMSQVFELSDAAWPEKQHKIKHALDAAKQVSAKALAESGLKGMAIKEALEQKRLYCIGEVLNL